MSGALIVGASQAGVQLAVSLRELGYTSAITLVGAEAYPPYQRPPLSKGYLAGKEGADAVILQPEQWYAEQSIDLRMSTRAVDLDPAAHELELDDGSALRYDSALLAMGASARSLPLEGADLPAVASQAGGDHADVQVLERIELSRGAGRAFLGG